MRYVGHGLAVRFQRLTPPLLASIAIRQPQQPIPCTCIPTCHTPFLHLSLHYTLTLTSRPALPRSLQDGRTPLHWAASAGNLNVTQLILSNSPDVEARDALGWTPLVVAAASGQSESARELLDAGAKVDAANDKGQTALHYAASKGNVPVS